MRNVLTSNRRDMLRAQIDRATDSVALSDISRQLVSINLLLAEQEPTDPKAQLDKLQGCVDSIAWTLKRASDAAEQAQAMVAAIRKKAHQ